MKVREPFHMPPEQRQKLNRARRLEWISIGALISITIVMYLAMGSSQAMRTAWIEDVLSLVAPISLLVASHLEEKPPDEMFPHGRYRATMLAFMMAAVTLTVIGSYTLYDAVSQLLRMERPTIGLINLFGWHIWMGWIMVAALIYSVIPVVILGRLKLPLARDLHEKTLYADADTNKADWLTGVAAMFGVLGIGLGWWWADGVAAAFISIEILRDGLTHTRDAFADLMDRRPMTVEKNKPDPIVDEVRQAVADLDWVKEVDVRLREDGEVIAGSIFVVPTTQAVALEQIRQAEQAALAVNWRVSDIVVTAVPALDGTE